MLRERLAADGKLLSSANSINWGRVLPQIVYYISAYCDLLTSGAIRMGEKIDFCVPTGNFGNILAAYYAKRMGLPVGKLICASNSNDVLTEFIRTGVYDRNRPFHATMSPSMDILISSNLERLLYLLSGSDEAVRGYMRQLSETGRYAVTPELHAKIQESFACGCCDEASTAETIGRVFRERSYLIDTHTAVAWNVLEQFRRESGSRSMSVVVSTASAFKFCASVLTALGVEKQAEGTQILRQLSETTGCRFRSRWRRWMGRRSALQRPFRKRKWQTRSWSFCNGTVCDRRPAPVAGDGQADGRIRRPVGGLCGQAPRGPFRDRAGGYDRPAG